MLEMLSKWEFLVLAKSARNALALALMTAQNVERTRKRDGGEHVEVSLGDQYAKVRSACLQVTAFSQTPANCCVRGLKLQI